MLVKLRASGSLDSAFGTRGQVVPALPGTSLDGIKSIQTFRDGRIVAAGTLRLADGTTRFVTLRLLPTGRDRPELRRRRSATCWRARPTPSSRAMVMDRDGNVFLGGESGGAPLRDQLLPDGTRRPGLRARRLRRSPAG